MFPIEKNGQHYWTSPTSPYSQISPRGAKPAIRTDSYHSVSSTKTCGLPGWGDYVKGGADTLSQSFGDRLAVFAFVRSFLLLLFKIKTRPTENIYCIGKTFSTIIIKGFKGHETKINLF